MSPDRERGYMTVGQLAKRMGTTVRTLQYYDLEGLLSPADETSGGRRLYSDKDMIRLHQIQSLKYLGFSLDEIRHHLVALDTPDDVAAALTQQASSLRAQIKALKKVLSDVEKLRAECLAMDAVDFGKYADIVELLRAGNQNYWVVRVLDEQLLDHARTHFDDDSGQGVLDAWRLVCEHAVRLRDAGEPPDGEAGLAVAAELWTMVEKFTGGDLGLLPNLMRFASSSDAWPDAIGRELAGIQPYLSEALGAYFARQGVNPFEGVEA